MGIFGIVGKSHDGKAAHIGIGGGVNASVKLLDPFEVRHADEVLEQVDRLIELLDIVSLQWSLIDGELRILVAVIDDLANAILAELDVPTVRNVVDVLQDGNTGTYGRLMVGDEYTIDFVPDFFDRHSTFSAETVVDDHLTNGGASGIGHFLRFIGCV